MSTNPIKLKKNPNTPEAIQARLDGLQDPTEFEYYHLITENTEKYINIDLTKTKVDQRVGYIITGGSKHLNKKLVNIALQHNLDGTSTITSYYIDTMNKQWVIIKSPFNRPFTEITSGSYGGYYANAKGTTWRNEGRSVDSIRRAQQRIYKTVSIDPSSELEKEQPEDRFINDFTGQH